MTDEELKRIGDMLSNEEYRDCMECSWDARASSLYEHIQEQEVELRALREVKAEAEALKFNYLSFNKKNFVALCKALEHPALAATKEPQK